MKNYYRFIIITILAGTLHSCAVRWGFNGSWQLAVGSVRIDNPQYLPTTSDTLEPGVTRDTGAPYRIEPIPQTYLTVRGRNLTLSYDVDNYTDSTPIMYRKKYLGKYKRRKEHIIATFDRVRSTSTNDGTSTTTRCEEFTMTFYYSKSTKTLYELNGNDTTFYKKISKPLK